jgi:hypothetical protein
MAVQYAFGKIITQGLDLNVDAADPTSYTSGSSSWISVVNRSITGSIISCSYSSDFKGGIVFNNPSASVQFPGTVANYGTGSFTVEMAFRPDQINGIHYLVSDNSGSFPNWGVYLSGSAGSGKLFSFYNISSTVSCSVSSSSTFVTGSNYFVDTIFAPVERRTYINIEGNYDAVSTVANGTGSLTTTASLFLGNLTSSSSQAYSGSVFSTKVYSTFNSGFINFKSVAPRVGKAVPARASSALALIVAGGGASPTSISAGGGAGGFLLTTTPLTTGTYSVFVGDGGRTRNTFSGSNGQTSSIANLVALGGGGAGGFPPAGGSNPGTTGSNGGSGGGGGTSQTGGLRSAGGTGSIGQGNNGGGGGDSYGGGGGGGAGNPGSNAVGGSGGRGGDGLISSISGFATYYAGGGGGGTAFAPTPGSGGLGGGGNGSSSGTGSAGSANTGGGAGGSGNTFAGADGGSGIVIIRYPGAPIATGGTVTSFGGDTIHTFTATGSSTFTVF